MTKRPSFSDMESLSAYLDGELSRAESTRLEARLASKRELRESLDSMRQSRSLLRSLPKRRAPRNFLLTASMAGLKPPLPRIYPVLRRATVLITVLLALSFAANFAAPLAAAPKAEYGIGGGQAEESTDLQSLRAMEATPTLESAPPPAPAEAPVEMPALAASQEMPEGFEQEKPAGLIPIAWLAGLAILAAISGGTALTLLWNANRAFKKNLKKRT